jgi:uncharacterized protein (TIGR02246 family)
MRRCTIAVALVLAAACAPKAAESIDSSTAAAAVAAPSAANTKADEDSINALNTRWKAALASKDTTAIGALFADDGAAYTSSMPPARGASAVAAHYGGMYRMGKDVKLTFDPKDLAVAQAGDLAVERGTYELSWTDAKGKATTDRGSYVATFKKVNGQWKVFSDMAVSEMPMPGM